ncbi:hydrogenase small subunit [Thiolapillus sp.]
MFEKCSRKSISENQVRVNTNKGDKYYADLYRKCRKRIDYLRKKDNFAQEDFYARLAQEGISRRDFFKWISATTASLMLPVSFEPLLAQTIEVINRVPVIWANFQDCAGNSEALLRTDGPTVDELILDIISLEFHELLMAPSGEAAEQQLADAMTTFQGEYILFVEGSIPTADNGVYGTIGASGETYVEHITRLAADCAAIVAVGSCATFGGVPSAAPNPTGAKGVMDVVTGKPIVNIPACPANPSNILGVVLLYTMTGELPDLDPLLRPKFAFGTRIHDACERRVHFDVGNFVEEWGDEGAQKGYCLYKMGCKGPFTFNNCPTVKFNRETSWPVAAGHGCIGCSEPGFFDKFGAFEKPALYDSSYNPASDVFPVENIVVNGGK